MELKIYDKTGRLRLTASPSSSSTVTEEVGGECCVSVSFTHTSFVMLDAGDYVEAAGMSWRLKSPYRPTQKDTQTYSYSVKFHAPIHDAEDTLMVFRDGTDIRTEFSYDGGPREHLQLWVDNMNRRAGAEVWSVGTVIAADNRTIEYRNVYCWDAAFGSNGIAAAFETEMWADGHVINLCRAERGERIELGYLQGLASLSQEENGGVRFFTRLFPLGSTRNIDATRYGHARLQLPSGAVYVDRNTDLYGVREAYEEDAFSGIYPRYTGTVSSVRTEEKQNEEGRKYTVHYFKDGGMDWNPKECEIPGLTYMLSFQTGELAGRGNDEGAFEAAWHEDTKEWEIVNVYPDDTTQIPGGEIVPKPGDTYIPWNFALPQEYIDAAEQEYAEAVDDFLATYSLDTNKYSGETDRNYVERNATPLRIGQNVRLLSEEYFAGGHLDTRMVKVVRRLDDLCRATVTCAEEVGKGWKGSVDGSLSELKYEVARQAERAVFDIIRSTDSKTPSDSNFFSALKSLMTHLRKDAPDSTVHLMRFLGGIVTDFIQSTDFVSGMMGTGFTIKKNADGTTYAEVDRLLVRMKAYFQAIAIMRTEVGGATMMFNPSGARITITKVEHIDSVPFYYSDGSAKYYSDGSRAYVQPSEYGAVYRCHFLADDGETAIQNLFKPGNLARSQSFNIRAGVHEGVSNRFFWRLVTAVGDDWIELSATHCAEGSDIPQEGDVVCQLGDISDPDYQSAIVLSAFGDGAPYLTFYQGIDSYSLSGKDVFTVGYDSVKRECFMRGYGRMYFGDRERKSYIEYTQEDGLRTRGKFLLESGEEVGAKISAMESQISLKVGKDQLKATGIDIDSKTVKVTASQFLVQDNGGTGIAVFKLVNGKPVLKAENIDVDGLKVKHLEGADGSFSGELKAVTGTYSSIKATSGRNNMLLNGSLISFSGSYSTVRLGADAIPDSAGGSVSCPLYIDTHRSGATNIGISVRATGGGKNYGLSTNAAVLAASLVGTRAKRLTLSSGGGTIDFSQDSLFIITCNGNLTYNFPDAVSVMDMFGYDSLPGDFGYLFLIHLKIGSGNLTVNRVYNEEGHVSTFTMYPGDSTWFLAYSNGMTVRYQIVSKYA